MSCNEMLLFDEIAMMRIHEILSTNPWMKNIYPNLWTVWKSLTPTINTFLFHITHVLIISRIEYVSLWIYCFDKKEKRIIDLRLRAATKRQRIGLRCECSFFVVADWYFRICFLFMAQMKFRINDKLDTNTHTQIPRCYESDVWVVHAVTHKKQFFVSIYLDINYYL